MKKSYKTPKLVVHGSLKKITKDTEKRLLPKTDGEQRADESEL